MATLTIRKLDDAVKAKLRVRAATHGRSMEEEAREILREGLNAPVKRLNLYDEIRRLIDPIGGIKLDIPVRQVGERRLAIFD